MEEEIRYEEPLPDAVMPTLEPWNRSQELEFEALPVPEISNVASVEVAWAKRAHRQMEIHHQLLCTTDPKQLKLTDLDDDIYAKFKEYFPNFPVEKFKEEDLKSEEAKIKKTKEDKLEPHYKRKKWRAFIEEFDGKVEDGRFGCLIRIDADGEYSPENTILGVRVQFLAVEIARNREGFNDAIHKRSDTKS